MQFTTSYNRVEDVTINCAKFVPGAGLVATGDTVHWIYTTPVVQALQADANTNKHGKLTSWNLTGINGLATTTDGPTTKVMASTCPATTVAFSIADRVVTNSPPSGLQVNRVELPNTPVL